MNANSGGERVCLLSEIIFAKCTNMGCGCGAAIAPPLLAGGGKKKTKPKAAAKPKVTKAKPKVTKAKPTAKPRSKA